jgi:hypothetical protein
MLKSFVKALTVSGMATLAYTTTAVITPAPAAAQFRGGYALDDNDDVFDHRPARGRIELDEEDEAPRVERRIVERHVMRPIVERRVIEREIVQPVVERTVVHRVVQPVVERRVVYQRPIVRKVVVVHRPVVRRAHFVHRPWHERRRCFLPERYLCG